jgi:hypothetical protein
MKQRTSVNGRPSSITSTRVTHNARSGPAHTGYERCEEGPRAICALFEAISPTQVQTLRLRVEQQSEAEYRRGLGWAYGGPADRGGANRANSLRIGLFSTYCAGMFRQLENNVLGTARDIVAGASPQLLTRLGFLPWQAYGRLEQNTSEEYADDKSDRDPTIVSLIRSFAMTFAGQA